jgi:hypothetical protein
MGRLLRFKIPVNFYIVGDSNEKIELETFWVSSEVKWKISFLGPDKTTSNLPLPPTNDKQYNKLVHSILIESISENEDQKIGDLIEGIYRSKLAKIILSIGNRCIEVLRNIGRIYNLKTYPLDSTDNERTFFIQWNVEIKQQSEDWHYIDGEPEGLLEYLLHFGVTRPSDTPEFDGSNWYFVEEYIQNEIEIPPEFIFSANAIEHSRAGNYRVALLESVIGLEIILTKYLRVYFADFKKTGKYLYEKALTSTNLTLNIKITLLLQLTLKPENLKNINWKSIVQAINWRNKIMHASGDFPANTQKADIVDGILAIINLSIFLGYETERLLAYHPLHEIALKVKDENSLESLSLELTNRHGVRAYSTLIERTDFPTKEQVIRIAENLSTLLSNRDKIFDPNKHLLLEIFDLGERRAVWLAGKLISYT